MGNLKDKISVTEFISDEGTPFYTLDELKKILETEAWLLNVRESQAHVKVLLQRHPEIPLKRDIVDFAKEAVFKSSNGQYFIRSLANNFVDANNQILQFSLLNLWEGKKFHKKNLHPLIVLPVGDNPWGTIFAIKNALGAFLRAME